MGTLSNSASLNGVNFLERQPCIRAVKSADLPRELQIEIELFIQRNTLPDCGRVPPNCLKAFIIDKAVKLGLTRVNLKKLSKLFPSKIGYKGYYLDAGKLRRIKLPKNLGNIIKLGN